MASGYLSALATLIGALATNFILGSGSEWLVFSAGLVSLVAAGVWGYALEGGSRLARPFGYFGSLIAMIVFLAILYYLYPINGLQFAAAFTVGAALCQGMGRLRCMMQGCCHGRKTNSEWSMTITNPMSRVVAYENLKGVPIYATQLFSLIQNTVIALILIGFLQYQLPVGFIGGAYLILTGLTRFVEEQYRGESQTAVYRGLSVYQWTSIIALLSGIGLTLIQTPDAAPVFSMSLTAITTSLLLALIVFFAMGIDFPNYSGPLSRLAPVTRSPSQHFDKG